MLVLRKKDNTKTGLQFMFATVLVFVLRESVNRSVNPTSQQNANSRNRSRWCHRGQCHC